MENRKKVFAVIIGALVLCGVGGGLYVSGKKSDVKTTDLIQESKADSLDRKEIAEKESFNETDLDEASLQISHDDLLDKYCNQNKTIQYDEGSYAINVDDYNELINFADYCFVGTVNDIISVEMNSALQQAANTSGYPHTVYDVTVEESIKGEIEQGSRIKISKKGGLLKDLKTFEVMEGDNIPEVGKVYVFSACVQQDNTLLASGKNSTIECEKGVKDATVDKMDQVATKNSKKGKLQREVYSLDMDKVKIK